MVSCSDHPSPPILKLSRLLPHEPSHWHKLRYSPEKAMAPHSSILAWKIPWMEEPGRLQSMRLLRVGHNWATSLFTSHSLGKDIATHSSILAWRIPGTEEPSGLPSMGSHRVGHDWSDLAAAAGIIKEVPYEWWKTLFHSGNLKGFMSSLPVTKDKDQRSNIFSIIPQRVLPSLPTRNLTESVSLAQPIQILLSNTWKGVI